MAIQGVSLLDMDFSKEFPFEFAIQSYGCTKLNVMYTNDPDLVKLCLAEFKQYLQDEKAQGCRTRPCAHPFFSSQGPAGHRRPSMHAGRGSRLSLL